jgi:hypothetical protein
MKISLFSKTAKISFLLVVSAFLSNSLAMEIEGDVGLDAEIGRVKSYFQENALVIKLALEHVSSAELHFFWTTGRQPEAMKAEYGANFQVDIGGSRFGQKFPIYVGFLLEYSPAHLVIKLTCDELTRESNKEWMTLLQAEHPNRFQVLDIRNVRDNILLALPEQWETLQTVFQNATKGNPAIGSDIYRLIALVYGSNPIPPGVQNTQYTYCDVDTFCFGMSQPNQKTRRYFDFEAQEIKYKLMEENGHTNLVKALFCPMQMQQAPIKKSLFFVEPTLTVDTPVYIGRKDHDGGNSNNLIKLRIRDLQAYKSFCFEVLTKMLSSRELQTESLNLLTYFPTLHDHVSRGAVDVEKEFASYLETFSSSTVDPNDIMHVTGPGLVDRLKFVCFPLGQEYPDINEMEWNRIHYLERGQLGPLSDLGSGGSDFSASVYREFTNYARKLSNAVYVLRFGAKHPFTLKLMDHLRSHFPYASPSFKAYMKQLYEVQNKPSDGPTDSMDAWLDQKFDDLTKGLNALGGTEDGALIVAPYYVRLHHVLQQLGIDRPLTRSDIDFMK